MVSWKNKTKRGKDSNMFPITLKGKIKKVDGAAAAETFSSKIETCLLCEGMEIYEQNQQCVKFKTPFLLLWRSRISLLFLTSGGELTFEKGKNYCEIKYKIYFQRVIYPFLAMMLVSLFPTKNRFSNFGTVLAIGAVVLIPMISMCLITFKDIIAKCFENAAD